ncbi:hypothetical protein [Streptomyces sp. NBC_00557]|uniref:hypothetical protein n=1 Tax=Streptomyces sp. NBC_00557 TaxID=2975776 RepID=UPI002E822F2F|nr:hypothetical protein [Streptomyces sp. NBC_00557]WUC39019.1 hypothetical protein OG956_34685 [Streptomyces sp. NBC_00557]
MAKPSPGPTTRRPTGTPASSAADCFRQIGGGVGAAVFALDPQPRLAGHIGDDIPVDGVGLHAGGVAASVRQDVRRLAAGHQRRHRGVGEAARDVVAIRAPASKTRPAATSTRMVSTSRRSGEFASRPPP